MIEYPRFYRGLLWGFALVAPFWAVVIGVVWMVVR